MVASLTYEKKENFEMRPVMEDIGTKAQLLKDDLADLVIEDSLAFNKVLDALRVPTRSRKDELQKKITYYWQVNMQLKYLIELQQNATK